MDYSDILFASIMFIITHDTLIFLREKYRMMKFVKKL